MAALAYRNGFRSSLTSGSVPWIRLRIESVVGDLGPIFGTAHRVILRPVNLRLVEGAIPPERKWPVLFAESRSEHVILSDSSISCIWDALHLLDAGRPGAKPSTRTFMSLAEDCDWTEASERQFLDSYVLPFIAKWGLAESDEYEFHDEDGSSGSVTVFPVFVNSWIAWAQQLHDVLTAIITTEAGELIDEDLLWRLGDHYLSASESSIVGQHIRRRAGGEEGLADLSYSTWLAAWTEARTLEFDRWRSLRRQGQGLDLQRAVAADFLMWMGYNQQRLNLTWDAKGRRVSLKAVGWREIAFSQLIELFASTDSNVYLCSVCGSPFPLQPGVRRPRAGTNRFCSESCRKDAKRAANLRSWHRNKDRWTGRDHE